MRSGSLGMGVGRESIWEGGENGSKTYQKQIGKEIGDMSDGMGLTGWWGVGGTAQTIESSGTDQLGFEEVALSQLVRLTQRRGRFR